MNDETDDDSYRYEADGRVVEISKGDIWRIRSRSGSGWYTKKYKVHSVGPGGISYTMSFEGNFLDRQRDDPTLFGTTPVENGDARYVDTENE